MPRSDDEMIEFSGHLVEPFSTPAGWKFQSDFMKEPIWLPKRFTEWDPEEGIMKIAAWLVNKNSIE